MPGRSGFGKPETISSLSNEQIDHWAPVVRDFAQAAAGGIVTNGRTRLDGGGRC